MFRAATPRVRLYLLLGLNLGYTQADIATLEHSMVDWGGNTVTRNRHKTGQPQLAKLWPMTAALLRAEMTTPRKSAFMLLGENGNPLVSEKDSANGKPIKVDAIGHAFLRLKGKVNMAGDKRGFKHFRKTSADLIAKNNQDAPHLAELFLGHTQKGMVKFYAKQHYDLLFTATDKLAEVYNLN
jgi:integrase